MDIWTYCQEKAALMSPSLGCTSRFLAPEQQAALQALYAYLQELSHFAQSFSNDEVALAATAWWQNDWEKVFSDERPEHPTFQAMQVVLVRFKPPLDELKRPFEAILQHMSHIRYNTFDELLQFCAAFEGTLWRLAARVLGESDAQALNLAEQLGAVNHLTRIISKVGADAKRSKIYLALDDLAQFNIPVAVLLRQTPTREFELLLEAYLERTRNLFQTCANRIQKGSFHRLARLLFLSAVNVALLREIKRDGLANVLRYQIALPKNHACWVSFKTAMLWRFAGRFSV